MLAIPLRIAGVKMEALRDRFLKSYTI